MYSHRSRSSHSRHRRRRTTMTLKPTTVRDRPHAYVHASSTPRQQASNEPMTGKSNVLYNFLGCSAYAHSQPHRTDRGRGTGENFAVVHAPAGDSRLSRVSLAARMWALGVWEEKRDWRGRGKREGRRGWHWDWHLFLTHVFIV